MSDYTSIIFNTREAGRVYYGLGDVSAYTGIKINTREVGEFIKVWRKCLIARVLKLIPVWRGGVVCGEVLWDVLAYCVSS